MQQPDRARRRRGDSPYALLTDGWRGAAHSASVECEHGYGPSSLTSRRTRALVLRLQPESRVVLRLSIVDRGRPSTFVSGCVDQPVHPDRSQPECRDRKARGPPPRARRTRCKPHNRLANMRATDERRCAGDDESTVPTAAWCSGCACVPDLCQDTTRHHAEVAERRADLTARAPRRPSSPPSHRHSCPCRCRSS